MWKRALRYTCKNNWQNTIFLGSSQVQLFPKQLIFLWKKDSNVVLLVISMFLSMSLFSMAQCIYIPRMYMHTCTMLIFLNIIIVWGGHACADPLSCLDNALINYQYPNPTDALNLQLMTAVNEPHLTSCAIANVCFDTCVKMCPQCTVMTFALTGVRCIHWALYIYISYILVHK